MTLAIALPIIWKLVEIFAISVVAPLAAMYIRRNIAEIDNARLRRVASVAVLAAEELAASGRLRGAAKYDYAQQAIRAAFPSLSKVEIEEIIHSALALAALGASAKAPEAEAEASK